MEISKVEMLKALIAESADSISIPHGYSLKVISVQNCFEQIDKVFTEETEEE